MEAYLGTWKVEDNENFDQFLNHFGVPSLIAKLVVRLGSKTTFSKKGDAYGIKISSVKGKTEAVFTLDKEFEEMSSGGVPLKVSFFQLRQMRFFHFDKLFLIIYVSYLNHCFLTS